MKLPGATLEHVRQIYGSEGNITTVAPCPDGSTLTLIKQDDHTEIILNTDELELLILACQARLWEARREEMEELKQDQSNTSDSNPSNTVNVITITQKETA